MHLQKKRNLKMPDMTKKEFCKAAVKAGGITGITAWLYYRSLWAVIPLLPVWYWHLRMTAREMERQKEAEFLRQFKDMIQTLASALHTGYSVENAFRESQKELALIYPQDAEIMREMALIIRQLKLQITMEQALEEFAKRTKMEDVEDFVEVFSAAKKSGGNLIAIIQNTAGQIGDKIDVQREIETILAAKKYEFRVMAAVPYGIIGYMTLSFPEFAKTLYGNAAGIGVMTVCLAIYLGAYYLGIRIIRIEV